MASKKVKEEYEIEKTIDVNEALRILLIAKDDDCDKKKCRFIQLENRLTKEKFLIRTTSLSQAFVKLLEKQLIYG